MTEPMLSAVEAAEVDADSTPEGVLVPLFTDGGEVEVTVPPAGRWRTRANKALRLGDFDEWAQIVLSDVDYALWVDADPTNDDVEAFFKAWQAESGENQGKSRPSTGSSRSTRKR